VDFPEASRAKSPAKHCSATLGVKVKVKPQHQTRIARRTDSGIAAGIIKLTLTLAEIRESHWSSASGQYSCAK
jgi:hypothetical protein